MLAVTHSTRIHPRLLGLVGGAAVAAAVAGCGSSSPNKTTATVATPAAPASQAAAPAAAPAPARVLTRTTRLGRILVDAQGHTLYVFSADHGGHSACAAACARFWPPLTTGPGPTAGPGVRASLLGTTSGKGGATIVTYHGHPLYSFAPDTRPGQVKGEEQHAFGGRWDAISPAGAVVRPRPPAPKAAAVTPAPAQTVSTTVAPTTTQATAPTVTQTATSAPTQTAAPPVTRTTHTATPPPQTSSGGIPQGNGGDQDADNNGGPSDGDGNV